MFAFVLYAYGGYGNNCTFGEYIMAAFGFGFGFGLLLGGAGAATGDIDMDIDACVEPEVILLSNGTDAAVPFALAATTDGAHWSCTPAPAPALSCGSFTGA